MNRLTVVDEIFLRTHRGMGTPIALQGLWRTPDAMEPALLQAIHDRLRQGELGRRVIDAKVPGARRTWVPNTRAHPVDFLPNRPFSSEMEWPTTQFIAAPSGDAGLRAESGIPPSAEGLPGSSVGPITEVDAPRWGDGQPGSTTGPLAESDILPWADTLGTDLDPQDSPGWRLSAARLDDGGTVVALTCSHALADARGLLHAVTAALDSLAPDPTASTSRTAPHPLETRRAPYNPPSSDWADARTQWTTIVTGTAAAARRWRPQRTPDRQRVLTDADRRQLHSTVLTFDAHHWNTTASTANGTPNSLFIYLTANILWHTGFPNPIITASLPVDTRDEPRVDNDLAMTEITITHTDTPATIRDKARTAYQRRMSSPAGLPEQILQVIPDRLAYTLSKGAGERDILCSNIGTLPGAISTIGPHDCTRVAARAIHPGLTVFPRTRLSGYLSHLGDTYTLALVSLAADNDTLQAAIEKTCATAGLQPNPW
ncbi:hypothetical protein ACFWU5_28045 [Nocardia sp. NPDC058640]|uniref:hypothetical protein n=1 Tax=Nocardia sp. NPDC058640 TaxID=3346571 RepID=UPI00365B963C